MFEKDIKFIADFSINKIKKLGSFFTFEKLISTDLHPAIIKYISAELDFLIYEDRQNLLQNSVFDYSGPEIAKYFGLIGKEIKKTKKISFEDIRKLVIQAVSFNANFIIRPRWSLMKLIFGSKDEKSVDEIKLMLSSLHYYDYLRKICSTYIDKKKLILVSKSEFEVIMNKIDKELFANQTKELTDDALYSMADFFNVGGVSKNKISPASIELFLKEKNLIDYLFRLRKAIPIQARQKIDIEDIRNVLYSEVPVDKDFGFTLVEEDEEEQNVQIEKKDEQPKNQNNTDILKDDKNEPADEEEKIEIDVPKTQNDFELVDDDEENELTENKDNPEDSLNSSNDDELLAFYNSELELLDDDDEKKSTEKNEEEFPSLLETDDFEKENLVNDFSEREEENEISSIEEEIESEEEVELSDTFDASSSEINQEEFEFEEEFQIEEDEQKNDEIEYDENITSNITQVNEEKRNDFEKDLFTYLSNKEIEKIVNSVFNDDREDFVSSLEKVMECSSYEEATEILKGVFLTYRVNPYSRDAVVLTNAVSNYFNQA